MFLYKTDMTPKKRKAYAIMVLLVFVTVAIWNLPYQSTINVSFTEGYPEPRDFKDQRYSEGVVKSKLPNHDAAIRWLRKWVTKLGANTKKQYIFYNRVGKCGSTTIMSLTKDLSTNNNFRQVVYYQGVQDKRFGLNKLPPAENARDVQQNSLKLIQKFQTSTLHIHHTFYIDFDTVINISKPIYINSLRDPLTRAESSYYHRQRHSASERWNKMSFEECIVEGMSRCSDTELVNGAHVPNHSTLNRMLVYLCGSEDFCNRNATAAVQQALRHLEENYLIVGHLERINDFVSSLEFLLPEYFRGANRLVKRRESVGNLRRNVGEYPRLSTESSNYLRRVLEPSYVVYNKSVSLFSQRFSLIQALRKSGIHDRLELQNHLDKGYNIADLLSRLNLHKSST